jgi:cation transporter-like permease
MEWRLILFPVAAALLGIGLGWALARWAVAGLAWAVCALLLAGALAMVVSGQGRPGFEGVGYVAVAVLMLAPAGLGVALGTVILAAQRRRAG